MKDFYTRFYLAMEHSQAHHVFCERAFGIDLCQHGFADREQLELLIQVTHLGPCQRVLDLGCGNGKIAEYLSDCTGAHVTGLDYIPYAIRKAQQRTAAKSDRLSFVVGDMNQLDLPKSTFDLVLSIDTLYFPADLIATIGQLKETLKPGGRIAIFYSYGREPWVSKEDFPKDKLAPERTPLADALSANGLAFRTWDLTRQDYELAQRRKRVLQELKPQFEAEEIMFIYENRIGDSGGISEAFEEGLHSRYLYLVG